MRKDNQNKVITFCMLATLALSSLSCKKMFDIEPQNVVEAKNNYQTVADADAAVLGVYGMFGRLSQSYVLMNELRADLMEVTSNADPLMKELSTHSVSAGGKNPYASPKPFYEVILQCNDVLKNFNIMKEQSKMSVADYNERYSDVGMLRSWIYLQLGIHFGTIPYITDPVETVDDIKNVSEFPRIPLTTLIDTLVKFAEKLPSRKNELAYPRVHKLSFITENGYETSRMFINRVMMMGDLYLWDDQFKKAAEEYRIAMEIEGTSSDLDARYSAGRITYSFFTVSYIGGGPDTTALDRDPGGNSWGTIFLKSSSERRGKYEWYWTIPYSDLYSTENPLIKLFSASPVWQGKYLVRPSRAIYDFWNSQVQDGGLPYDARRNLSTRSLYGVPEITKHTAQFEGSVNNEWKIWRAAGLHLRFAEAANLEGYPKLAWALINRGILNTWKPDANLPATYENSQLGLTKYPAPFDFDARFPPQGFNSERGNWYRNNGIRGRARLLPHPVETQENPAAINDQLILENALELAFEGERWPTLLRMAMRAKKPEILAEKIRNKFKKEGQSELGDKIYEKLSKGDWFLPFD